MCLRSQIKLRKNLIPRLVPLLRDFSPLFFLWTQIQNRCLSLLPLHCPYHMPHISSKRSKQPLINQRIAELISRGKLPKSLWPRVHVGPGGAYLLWALICPSAHAADSSSLKSSSGNLREPLSQLWPIKTTQAKQQGRCSSSNPKDSQRALLFDLLIWKIAVRKRRARVIPSPSPCQNNNCTASRDTHQDPGHHMNLPAPASLSVGGRLRRCSRAEAHTSKQIRLCGNNLQTDERICCSPGAYRRLGRPQLLLL